MGRIKFFEDFKVKNITQEDIIDCIKSDGSIYASIVKDYPKNKPDIALKPVDITDSGEITVDIDGELYSVDLEDVERLENSSIVESKKISIVDEDLKKHLPESLSIITSNGEFELILSDCWVQFPKLCVTYWHSTPSKTGDVLTDGEPDYLAFDFNFVKRDDHFEINVENTYGDAMMFEYKIVPPNTVQIGHYNGYKSKFDPKYVFAYTEESIQKLISFYNSFTFGVNLTRDKFNFIDIKPDSFKIEKVGYKLITNFSKFD